MSRRTIYFNVTVLAGDAAELSRIGTQLGTRIHNLLYVGDRTGCGSFRLRSEAYSPTYQYLLDVSAAFPSAVFLVEAYDIESWTDKMVFHGGQLLCEANDDSRTQGGVWALPNIFEPFRAEYELGVPFGSLWNEWVDDMNKALSGLKGDEYEKEAQAPNPEHLDMTFADELPGMAEEPSNEHKEPNTCEAL